jgi:RHS repeat-associated protein
MRTATSSTSSLVYFLGDHLGSTSITVNPDGSKAAEMRYTAWGETRYTLNVTPTDYQYTGQRNEAGIGLYYYNARWYDPYITHFTQPDSIVPDPYNPQAYNRYSYALNNPIRYNDPSGHCPEDEIECRVRLLKTLPIPKQYVNVWDTSTHASEEIVKDIEGWEENIDHPYDDSNGYCTAGIGHQLHAGSCTTDELGTKYSPEQIQEWFATDLAEAESDVRAMFQTLDNAYRPASEGFPPGNPVPIIQAQFDALVSFTFNAGAGALIGLVGQTAKPVWGSESGTFNFAEFSNLMLGIYAQGGPGLLPRRQQEVNLFVNGVYP